ncbi:MAG: hypothetical protein KKI12_07500 [Proteobacteria bacterium]|nr:hypothetical protein [Pseudomonadota bacterium]
MFNNFDESKACRNCLLPEPYAQLNENQTCHECLSYRPHVVQGIAALQKELDTNKGKEKYDCMVAISGGRDSMYALYFAKKNI